MEVAHQGVYSIKSSSFKRVLYDKIREVELFLISFGLAYCNRLSDIAGVDRLQL